MKKLLKTLPTLKSKSKAGKDITDFPLEHYSYSSFTKASSNPIMFKINNINGDIIESTTGAAAVLGGACHRGVQAFLGGEEDIPTPVNHGEALAHGYNRGVEYLEAYSDGFIAWSKTIPNRQTLHEKFSFAYYGYIKDLGVDYKSIILIEKMLKYKIEVEGQNLPIPLKGAADLVYENKKKQICIIDHKFVGRYSNEDGIDGAKLLQAAFMYFLVYAETGREPYSITFREFKHSKNADGSTQTKEYPMLYKEMPMMFEFFYRFYQDVTRMILGESVWLPNLQTLYDNDVSILAYINRLDIEDERNTKFEKMKVKNITELLSKEVQNNKTLKKYLKTVNTNFMPSKALNYKDMKIEEKIRMKLGEHGQAVKFDSKVSGSAVTLYKYEPGMGVKMSKIGSYAKDIEQVVEVSGIRILAPIPNSSLIGFEIPNAERVFTSEKAQNDGFNLAMGVDIMGKTKYFDIREAPHLLVSGATGSGKSVFLNSLINQILTIPNASMYLFDPKMVELHGYKDLKNVKSYQSEAMSILLDLQILVNEMNLRYKYLQENNKKNIDGSSLDYIFAVIDEYGDLVNQNAEVSKEIKKCVLLLAQKARAAGIHIILTTQRPSIKIIDGDIKANFPARVAFKVATQIDSNVVLDEPGAEKLLGKGDMLLKTNDGVVRLQGYSN